MVVVLDLSYWSNICFTAFVDFSSVDSLIRVSFSSKMSSTESKETETVPSPATNDLSAVSDVAAENPVVLENGHRKAKDDTVCCVKPPSFLWFLQSSYPENVVVAESKSIESASEEVTAAVNDQQRTIAVSETVQSPITTITEVEVSSDSLPNLTADPAEAMSPAPSTADQVIPVGKPASGAISEVNRTPEKTFPPPRYHSIISIYLQIHISDGLVLSTKSLL